MTSKYLQKFQSNSLEMFPRINEQNHDRGGQLTEDHLEEEMMLNMGEEKAIKRNSSYSMWRLLDNSDNCPDPGSDSLSIDSKNESCVSAKRAKLDETSSDSSDLQNGDTMSQENLIGANTTPADVNAESVNNLMAIIKNILATSQKKEEPFKNGPSQLDALKNVLSGIINKKTCSEEQPKLNPAAEVKSDTISQQQTPQATAFQHDLLFGPSMKANLLPNPYTFFSTLLAKTSQNSCGNLFSQNFLNPNVLNPLNRKLSQSSMTNTSPPSLHRSNMANLKHTAHSNSIIESFSNSLFFNPSGNNGTKDLFRTNFPNKSLFGKLTTHEEIHHRMNQTPAVRDTNSLLASAQLAAACNSDNFGYTCTLTPVHLRKAKLMFFYVRYPNSSLLKIYFPDVRFNKNNTAQLVKWFSNFREFYYIQMEKFARLAITEGVQSVDEISITVESELYRSLNLHYNRNQQIEVPDQFLHVVEATLKEFYLALSTGKDNEQSWKKPIYKIIARLDQPVPEFFKSPNWINQLTDG